MTRNPPTDNHFTLISHSPVAKHYLTSRQSFEETARYWAETYAGAPRKAPEDATPSASSNAGPRDEIAIAGLERDHVDQFTALGFPQSKVVSKPSHAVINRAIVDDSNSLLRSTS